MSPENLVGITNKSFGALDKLKSSWKGHLRGKNENEIFLSFFLYLATNPRFVSFSANILLQLKKQSFWQWLWNNFFFLNVIILFQVCWDFQKKSWQDRHIAEYNMDV